NLRQRASTEWRVLECSVPTEPRGDRKPRFALGQSRYDRPMLSLLYLVEAVQQSFVIWALPVMFASSALVPTDTMADWLRPFVEHQPVSVLINAIRSLLLNQ